ncbi:MAG: transketolase [Porphyromonas sp.]|nr:transketolase [Bacteroidales bacterium]MDY3099821.1 transketolase [Porphyromonas sp.]
MSKKPALSQIGADNVRILALSMVEKAKSGHPGGAMGGADFAYILYSEFLRFNPDDAEWFQRDRFFLDPGHMSAMLYSVLCMTGRLDMEDLKQFRQWQSHTPGHPELDVLHGIENSSGPLGQGHAIAVGAAIAAKKMAAEFGETAVPQRIFAFISDGGVQEEISQGAGRIAGHLGLDNLVMFYDANRIQLSTEVDEVTSEDVEMKYKAWGWHVIVIDGNDHGEIRHALKKAIDYKGKPTLIIGNTVMGKGAVGAEGESFENLVSTHGQPLSKAGASTAETIKHLGGDPEDPFRIFPEVRAVFDKRKDELRAEIADWRKDFEKWEKNNADKATELKSWLSGKVENIDWSAIEQKPDIATRNASAAVLGELAKKVPNMIVSSADLSNSDKTDGFLKQTKPIVRGDFSGKFINIGVSELTMAALSMGLALHGGIIPACGTFFAFSDYMKPAIRLAALMGLHIVYIWTHDAFRVGEDGPTHEPVEQEAQIRLLEKLQNHAGKNSMLVLRPADNHETTVAWKMALENLDTPTGLILSRQDIKTLPANDYEKSLRAEKGGYNVATVERPAAILVGNGSEVSTLVAGAEILKGEGIEVNIASIPSEGVFRNQPKAYQDAVLIPGVPRFGLTAGLPVTLQGLVPEGTGEIWGMKSFGFSAPYKVLDEKLGFTPENVAKQVHLLLDKQK